MISDKITYLRKEKGWSQEDLAEKMEVSRQSVSKWEANQSVPDLDKIIRLSQLFGVTTDYLLKDDISEPVMSEKSNTDVRIRRVMLDEAQDYIALRKKAAKSIAVGTLLCILSPIPIILLGAFTEMLLLSDSMTAFLGISALLIMVAVAVAIFIHTGLKNAPYEFLEKESFDLDASAEKYIVSEYNSFRKTFIRMVIIGTVLCILSVSPVLSSVFFLNSILLPILMLCALFVFVGIGVLLLILAGVKNEAYKKLLKIGEHSKNPQLATFEAIYWPIVVCIYLLWSFSSDDWGITWVTWVIAAAISNAVEAYIKSKDKK